MKCITIEEYIRIDGTVVQKHERCYQDLDDVMTVSNKIQAAKIQEKIKAKKEGGYSAIETLNKSIDYADKGQKLKVLDLSRVEKSGIENKSQLATLERLEEEIKDKDYETLYVVDKEGKVVHEVKGDAESVDLGPLLEENPDAFFGTILTHNHPNTGVETDYKGSSFSIADIRSSFVNGADGIRVIADDYTFEITYGDFIGYGEKFYERTPKRFRNNDIILKTYRGDMFRKKINPSIKAIVDGLQMLVRAKILAGTLTKAEAYSEMNDLTWSRLAMKLDGINYRIVKIR